jgi:hypothetical protein
MLVGNTFAKAMLNILNYVDEASKTRISLNAVEFNRKFYIDDKYLTHDIQITSNKITKEKTNVLPCYRYDIVKRTSSKNYL